MEKFSYEVNGYNRSEVNQFVEDIIHETEGIISIVKNQDKELEELRKELKRYQSIEGVLEQTLQKTEQTCNDQKRIAEEESKAILRDAKHNASRIVNEALLKADKIDHEREQIEKNMRIFKKKLRLIVEQQMAVVDEIEVLELE